MFRKSKHFVLFFFPVVIVVESRRNRNGYGSAVFFLLGHSYSVCCACCACGVCGVCGVCSEFWFEQGCEHFFSAFVKSDGFFCVCDFVALVFELSDGIKFFLVCESIECGVNEGVSDFFAETS